MICLLEAEFESWLVFINSLVSSHHDVLLFIANLRNILICNCSLHLVFVFSCERVGSYICLLYRSGLLVCSQLYSACLNTVQPAEWLNLSRSDWPWLHQSLAMVTPVTGHGYTSHWPWLLCLSQTRAMITRVTSLVVCGRHGCSIHWILLPWLM